MDDLISRKALIEKMNDTKVEIMFDLPVEELLGEDVDMDDFCTLLQDAIQSYRKLVIGEVMEKAPTVEAVPVVHGECIDVTGCLDSVRQYACSRCGSRPLYNLFGNAMLTNYCHFCSADMRKKVQG